MKSVAAHNRSHPRGGVLLEYVLALGMITAAALLLTQWMVSANHQRRLAEQRRLARQEIANRMERVALWPWDQLTAEQIQTPPLREELRSSLQGVKLSAVVTEEMEPLVARRIDLRLTWENGAGVELGTERLSAWRYAAEGAP